MKTKSLDELKDDILEAMNGDGYAEAARKVSTLRDNESVDRSYIYKALKVSPARYKPVIRDLAKVYLDATVKIDTPRYEVVSH